MKIPHVLICFLIFVHFGNSATFKDLIAQVINEIKPNMVTFYSDFKAKNIKNSCIGILPEILKKVPTSIVDLNKPPVFMQWEDFVVKYNRNTTAQLHFVVLSDDKNRKIYSTLELTLQLIQDSSFYLMNPKIFLVINREKNGNDFIDRIFTISDQRDFYDLVVLDCSQQRFQIISHNPFSKITALGYANSSVSPIFVDKMKMIGGYKMRVGVNKQYWPVLYKNYTKNYEHDDNLFLLINLFNSYKMFANLLNVTSEFVVPSKNVQPVFSVIEYNLDLFLSKIKFYWKANLRTSYNIKSEKFVLVVPVKQEKCFKISIDILLPFISIIGTIVIIVICAYFFKLNQNEWNSLNIFCLMLGITVNINPRRCLRTKIIYFLLVLIALFFVSDLLTCLTEIKYEISENPVIESFEDVLQKNITVFFTGIKAAGLSMLQKRITGVGLNVAKMAKISEKVKNVDYDKIWIMPNDNAEKLLSSSNVLGGIKHEINDLTFYQSQYILTFKTNSILRNKFDEIYIRIIEAGLDIKWKSDYEHANKIYKSIDNNHFDNKNEGLPLVLVGIMMLGIISGLIALLLEYLWKYCMNGCSKWNFKNISKAKFHRRKNRTYNLRNSKNIFKVKFHRRKNRTYNLRNFKNIFKVKFHRRKNMTYNLRKIQVQPRVQPITHHY